MTPDTIQAKVKWIMSSNLARAVVPKDDNLNNAYITGRSPADIQDVEIDVREVKGRHGPEVKLTLSVAYKDWPIGVRDVLSEMRKSQREFIAEEYAERKAVYFQRFWINPNGVTSFLDRLHAIADDVGAELRPPRKYIDLGTETSVTMPTSNLHTQKTDAIQLASDFQDVSKVITNLRVDIEQVETLNLMGHDRSFATAVDRSTTPARDILLVKVAKNAFTKGEQDISGVSQNKTMIKQDAPLQAKARPLPYSDVIYVY